MAMTPEETLHFIVKMAFRRSVGIVRGLRKHIDHQTEDMLVASLLREFDTAGWQITKIPGRSAGFTFDQPSAFDK